LFAQLIGQIFRDKLVKWWHRTGCVHLFGMLAIGLSKLLSGAGGVVDLGGRAYGYNGAAVPPPATQKVAPKAQDGSSDDLVARFHIHLPPANHPALTEGLFVVPAFIKSDKHRLWLEETLAEKQAEEDYFLIKPDVVGVPTDQGTLTEYLTTRERLTLDAAVFQMRISEYLQSIVTSALVRYRVTKDIRLLKIFQHVRRLSKRMDQSVPCPIVSTRWATDAKLRDRRPTADQVMQYLANDGQLSGKSKFDVLLMVAEDILTQSIGKNVGGTAQSKTSLWMVNSTLKTGRKTKSKNAPTTKSIAYIQFSRDDRAPSTNDADENWKEWAEVPAVEYDPTEGCQIFREHKTGLRTTIRARLFFRNVLMRCKAAAKMTSLPFEPDVDDLDKLAQLITTFDAEYNQKNAENEIDNDFLALAHSVYMPFSDDQNGLYLSSSRQIAHCDADLFGRLASSFGLGPALLSKIVPTELCDVPSVVSLFYGYSDELVTLSGRDLLRYSFHVATTNPKLDPVVASFLARMPPPPLPLVATLGNDTQLIDTLESKRQSRQADYRKLKGLSIPVPTTTLPKSRARRGRGTSMGRGGRSRGRGGSRGHGGDRGRASGRASGRGGIGRGGSGRGRGRVSSSTAATATSLPTAATSTTAAAATTATVTVEESKVEQQGVATDATSATVDESKVAAAAVAAVAAVEAKKLRQEAVTVQRQVFWPAIHASVDQSVVLGQRIIAALDTYPYFLQKQKLVKDLAAQKTALNRLNKRIRFWTNRQISQTQTQNQTKQKSQQKSQQKTSKEPLTTTVYPDGHKPDEVEIKDPKLVQSVLDAAKTLADSQPLQKKIQHKMPLCNRLYRQRKYLAEEKNVAVGGMLPSLVAKAEAAKKQIGIIEAEIDKLMQAETANKRQITACSWCKTEIPPKKVRDTLLLTLSYPCLFLCASRNNAVQCANPTFYQKRQLMVEIKRVARVLRSKMRRTKSRM
jgi:hypothetical protein